MKCNLQFELLTIYHSKIACKLSYTPKMRATFKTLFYVNRSKEKGGTTRLSVSGRVPRRSASNGTCDNQRNDCAVQLQAQYPNGTLGYQGNCAKGKSKEAREINFALDDIKAQIIKHYLRLSDREAYVTAEMVRNAFQGIGNEYETLLGAFDKDNANFKLRCGKDRAYSSYKVFVRNRNYVADFIKAHYKRKDISMLVIDFSRFARRRTCARLHQGVQHLPYDGAQSEAGNGMDGLYATEGCHYPRPQQRTDTPKSVCPNGMKEQQKEKDGRTASKPPLVFLFFSSHRGEIASDAMKSA